MGCALTTTTTRAKLLDMGGMKERILEALKFKPMTKSQLASEFGIKLSPVSEPVTDEQDQLERSLSALQLSTYVRTKNGKRLKRTGPVDVVYDPTRPRNDAFVNFLRK